MIKAQGGIFGWVSDSSRVLAALTLSRGQLDRNPQGRRR